MHQKIAQILRLPALLLAAALQILPIARVALPATQATADVLAIIFRWGAGLAAALGGAQAVSGASTVITDPTSTNIVEGVPFSLRLTTAPQQAGYWAATNLPDGISLVSSKSLWQLSGTPTVTGTYVVGLTAKSSANASKSETTTANLTINIAPGSVGTPPAFTTQPVSQVVTQGQTASFSATVTGTAPLTYFWLKGSTVMTNGPNSTFSIPGAQPGDAGTYSVIVSNSVGTVTSSNVTLTVNVAATGPVITSQPVSQSVIVGQTATFNVTATGTAPLWYLWRKGAAVVTNSTNPSFSIVNAQVTDAGTYSVIVSNSVSSATSSNATLTVNTVVVAPAITSQPTNQFVYQGQNVSFFVTASGTGPLSYQWRKNGAKLADNSHLSGSLSNLFTVNSATTNDSGLYTVVITNSAGSITSQVATLTVTNPVAWTMAVQISGNGTVSPNYNGQMLTIGNNYTMTATPAAGNVFSKWTGGIYSTAPALTFVMQRGLSLVANFVPSPFITLQGTYNGLFYENNGVSQLSSGCMTLNTTAAGSFRGILEIGSGRWPMTGKFDANGSATVTVKRGIMAPLTVALQLDLFGGSDQITGTVTISDNSWTAGLIADRAVFNARTNPCPFAGTYTLVIPGTPGATASPAGDGCGIVKVTTAGIVTMNGTLADGTRVSCSDTLSKSGQWGLYAPLYAGRGSVLSWLTFTNMPDRDIDGTLSWIRPVQPSAAFYNQGFAVTTEAVGSQYTRPPNGTAVLDFTNGIVILGDGGLAQSFTNQIQLNANNRVVNLSANNLLLNLNAGNGMFTGRAQDPATGKYLSFKGIVLQKQNAAGGFFINQLQSGEVYFGP